MNQRDLIHSQISKIPVQPERSFALEMSARDNELLQKMTNWVNRIGVPVIGCFAVVVMLAIGLRLFESHVVQQSEFSEFSERARYLKDFYEHVPGILVESSDDLRDSAVPFSIDDSLLRIEV